MTWLRSRWFRWVQWSVAVLVAMGFLYIVGQDVGVGAFVNLLLLFVLFYRLGRTHPQDPEVTTPWKG